MHWRDDMIDIARWSYRGSFKTYLVALRAGHTRRVYHSCEDSIALISPLGRASGQIVIVCLTLLGNAPVESQMDIQLHLIRVLPGLRYDTPLRCCEQETQNHRMMSVASHDTVFEGTYIVLQSPEILSSFNSPEKKSSLHSDLKLENQSSSTKYYIS